jgi:hypothetical protein
MTAVCFWILFCPTGFFGSHQRVSTFSLWAEISVSFSLSLVSPLPLPLPLSLFSASPGLCR